MCLLERSQNALSKKKVRSKFDGLHCRVNRRIAPREFLVN